MTNYMPPKNLEDLARKFGIGKYAKKPEPNANHQIGNEDSEVQAFSIQEDNDFYIINGVRINDEVKTVKWTKQLLDEGKPHTQDQWVEQTKDGDVRLASLPTYIATIIALYDNKNVEDQNQKDLVEKVRKMFETDFDPQKPYFMTSTRITYSAQGPDKIKHNYGYDEEPEISEEITGPHAWINQSSGLEQITEALTETSDLDNIEKAIEWVSTQKPYLWRLNSKPRQDEHRAVVLGRNVLNSRFIIYCIDDINGIRPARGAVIVERAENST
jgi:hypothetical protein